MQPAPKDSIVEANLNFQELNKLYGDSVSQMQHFATQFSQTLAIADSLGAPFDRDWDEYQKDLNPLGMTYHSIALESQTNLVTSHSF